MKKIGSIIIVSVVIMALAFTASAAKVEQFTDVPAKAWYYGAVKYAVDKSLFNGTSDTTFEPDTGMTRAMFVQVLANKSKIDKSKYQYDRFEDVGRYDWYYAAVFWANLNGIVTGESDTEFAPNKKITREQMATMLYRYTQVTKNDTSYTDKAYNTFPDSGKVSKFAVTAMKWATTHGVINGSNGKLDPKGTATRAQVAQVFKNADNLLDKSVVTDPPKFTLPDIFYKDFEKMTWAEKDILLEAINELFATERDFVYRFFEDDYYYAEAYEIYEMQSDKLYAEIGEKWVIRTGGQHFLLYDPISTVTSKFGQPQEIFNTGYEYDTYVYKNDTVNLFMVMVKNSKIVGFLSFSDDLALGGRSKFETNGHSYGGLWENSKGQAAYTAYFYTVPKIFGQYSDELEAAFCIDEKLVKNPKPFTAQHQAAIEKETWYIFNALRKQKGLSEVRLMSEATSILKQFAEDAMVYDKWLYISSPWQVQRLSYDAEEEIVALYPGSTCKITYGPIFSSHYYFIDDVDNLNRRLAPEIIIEYFVDGWTMLGGETSEFLWNDNLVGFTENTLFFRDDGPMHNGLNTTVFSFAFVFSD